MFIGGVIFCRRYAILDPEMMQTEQVPPIDFFVGNVNYTVDNRY